MDVKLTSEEGDVLLEVLQQREHSLLDKISHVKKDASRKALQKKETLLEHIIQKVEVEMAEEETFSDLWW